MRTDDDLETALQTHTRETSQFSKRLGRPFRVLTSNLTHIHKADEGISKLYCRSWLRKRIKKGNIALARARLLIDVCDKCRLYDKKVLPDLLKCVRDLEAQLKVGNPDFWTTCRVWRPTDRPENIADPAYLEELSSWLRNFAYTRATTSASSSRTSEADIAKHYSDELKGKAEDMAGFKTHFLIRDTQHTFSKDAWKRGPEDMQGTLLLHWDFQDYPFFRPPRTLCPPPRRW